MISSRFHISPKDSSIAKTASDIVSNNAKTVLYGLFSLIGFAVLMYAIIVTGGLIKSEQTFEQINGVYIAAISGSLSLGGILIAQLWGRD